MRRVKWVLFLLLLSVEGEDMLPQIMSPDISFSYSLDDRVSVNLGVRTSTYMEDLLNKHRQTNTYSVWFTVNF